MKKHIPNLLTCLNLLTGAVGCIASVNGDLQYAIYYVLLAGLFDFFDGFAARLLHVKSDIGKELDSLADVISFGLLPALYVKGLLAESGVEPFLLSYIGLIIAPFSALRLAKFNIDTRQSEQFIGLPTPANAIMLTSMSFLGFALGPWQLIAIAIVCSYLLVSPIPMLALKFSNYSFKDNYLKYVLIAVSVVLVAVFGLSGLPFVIPAYILLSVVGNFLVSKPE